MLLKLWNGLICWSFAVLVLGSILTLDEKGRSGIKFSNAEIKRSCEVDEHGHETCGMSFSLDDLDSKDDEYDEFGDDYELDDESDVLEDSKSEEDELAMEGGCKDTHELCSDWAIHGECRKNPGYMLKGCPLSCKQCRGENRESETPKNLMEEKVDKIIGEQEMLIEGSKTFGVEQEVSGENALETLLVIRQSLSYMDLFVNAENPTHSMSEQTTQACQNKMSLCSFWSAIGECVVNLSFMLTNCAPACQSCHKIDFETRCPPRDPNEKPAWLPGDMHRMFDRIVTQTTYPDVTVYSRSHQSTTSESTIQIDKQHDPWVITIDNFLTDEECDTMIQLGYDHGYERSKDVSSLKNDDGTFQGYENDRRTSKNTWCSQRNHCRQKPIPQTVHDRIEQITNIPAFHSEDFQLLKYEEGEFYREHHDFIEHQVDRACGPRILTVFLYLTDVDEGGGTAFPSLKHTVLPKKGRVLLWPSVMNTNPNVPDPRMRHEALPVIKGKKFAANAWIHLYDVVSPTLNGCA